MQLPATPAEMLDYFRARLDIPSDYQAAKVLSVSRGALSTWRTERDSPSDEVGIRLAEFLELPEIYVLARCHEHRANRSGNNRAAGVWRKLAEEIAGGLLENA